MLYYALILWQKMLLRTFENSENCTSSIYCAFQKHANSEVQNPTNNRPFSSCLYLGFKTSPSAKPFIWKWVLLTSSFSCKSTGLVLKQRQKATWKWPISFFTAVKHNYDDNQRTLKKEINKMDRNLPITSHGRDLSPFEPLFPVTYAKMIDSSEKHKHWLRRVRMLLKGAVN